MAPNSVDCIGSGNLPDAETVMREIGSRIPTGVRRIIDGETGERGYWILFQVQKFQQMPEFDQLQEDGTIPAGVRFQMQYPTRGGLDRGNDRH